MADTRKPRSKIFVDLFNTEKSSGGLLVICTIVSLALANSSGGHTYQDFWRLKIGGLTLVHWINDASMAVFFLFIGLELKRELYVGELSKIKNALLPVAGAIGGIAVPAAIHLTLNFGTPTQAGVGIPMATDIAFALAALALLGNRVPLSLKVFLTALAVIDDLGAIVAIAVFYSTTFSMFYVLSALVIFAVLVSLNRVFRVKSLVPYLFGGALMWIAVFMSGVHATIAGVLLAFAIPFSATVENMRSPSYRLEHSLRRPVGLVILPMFALANTAILVDSGWQQHLLSSNSIGILAGLVLGKPLGITAFSFLAVASGLCRLPADLNWRHIAGAGLLAGIGFTMAVFITNLAFTGAAGTINASKMAILFASVTAGALGILWLRFMGPTAAPRARPGQSRRDIWLAPRSASSGPSV